MGSNCAIVLLFFVSLINALVCCNADNFLLSGNVLIAGSSLRYKNYVFKMQRDCNLVLYDRDNQIWATNTPGLASNCYCYLGKDGNLAIKTLVDAKVIWSSGNTQGKNGNYVLVVQNDRNVVIYGPPIWTSDTNAALAMSTTEVMNINQTDSIALLIKSETDNADNVLYSGFTLSSGSSLRITNYVLTMQEDCNLVLYDSGKPIWATNTQGAALIGNCYCYLQNDGNLMVKASLSGRNLWSSNTQRNTGYYVLVLQRDGKLVIYGPPIWHSATNRASRGVSITNVRKIKETNTSIASV